MNPETAREDVLTLEPGAAVVYDEPLKLDALRTDVVFYPVPFDELVAPICPEARLRRRCRAINRATASSNRRAPASRSSSRNRAS